MLKIIFLAFLLLAQAIPTTTVPVTTTKTPHPTCEDLCIVSDHDKPNFKMCETNCVVRYPNCTNTTL